MPKSLSPGESLMQPLKVGIVGLGYWGPNLSRNFHELPGATVSALCDLREDRLSHMKKLYPEARITRRFQDFLESDLDAIAIATPVMSHYSMARSALETGKHVLVEKPIAASSAQALDLIQLARDAGLTLMVGNTFEYNPAVETVKRIVASGELGDIFYINCTRVNLGLFQPDINVLWDLAPHDFSLLRFILDMEPVSISAYGNAYIRSGSDLPEVVHLNLNFPHQVMANLRISWLYPIKVRRTIIIGRDKMLKYDDLVDEKVIIYDKGTSVPPYTDTEQEFRMSYRDNGYRNVPFESQEPLRVECGHFLDCIRTKTTPRSDGFVGWRIVQMLEAAQKSITQGGKFVAVEYDPVSTR
jgi:predicted dehydrogenase